jgi:hypothetical protein
VKSNIKNGIQKLDIEEGKQGKHIKWHNNYTEGRSYITISMEEAQKLVNKYAGTGEFLKDSKGNLSNKELIETKKAIGKVIDFDNNEVETKRFIIHYSKKGTHIVPTLRDLKKGDEN